MQTGILPDPIKITKFKGGETASTGIYKLELHTERWLLVKWPELNIVADDYSLAVAA
jgi:hypothetical protein